MKVKYDDKKIITQIINNILPPAYQTTVELIKRDLRRQVPVTLLQVQEDIRQIYGQLQQNHILATNTIPNPRSLFIKTVLYLQHFLNRLNLFAAFVAKWAIRQLNVGITPTTKTTLKTLVSKTI
jgi:hypothetical protein